MSQRDRSWIRAIGIGLVVAALTALVLLANATPGMSPFPQPVAMAFAGSVLGWQHSLVMALVLHVIYVTAWAAIFVRYLPRRGLPAALMLACVLWIIMLLLIFPILGWGLAGTHISAHVVPASLVPHLIFGISLWLLQRYVPGRAAKAP